MNVCGTISILLLLLPGATSTPSIQLVEQFLSSSDITTVEASLHCDSTSKTVEWTLLPPTLMERIVRSSSAAAPLDSFELGDPNRGARRFRLPIRLLQTTSKLHQDYFQSTETPVAEKNAMVHDDVVFLFLNTNPDATFVHGNDRAEVRAGNMVRFRGDVPHQTLVPKGAVRLLGPFHAATFLPVGTSSPSSIPSGSPSSAPSLRPSFIPSTSPSPGPSTSTQPSGAPSGTPSAGPSTSAQPSSGPSASAQPSSQPSGAPSAGPSTSASPTAAPVDPPTQAPTATPIVPVSVLSEGIVLVGLLATAVVIAGVFAVGLSEEE